MSTPEFISELPPARGVVDFSHVSVQFGERTVLDDVDFALARGEFAYLLGRTGSGKSTLLRLIYGDLQPNQGVVRVEDFVLNDLPLKAVPELRRRLGIVFQDFKLLPEKTVSENLAFVLKATGWNDKTQIQNRIAEVLMLVGLSSQAQKYPHQLSGGEQQRTAIARALLNDPVLLVADEPTGNLDPDVANHILDVLHKANRAGTAVLMATHAYELIPNFPARTLKLQEGKLVAS